jgi:hypothetical protein
MKKEKELTFIIQNLPHQMEQRQTRLPPRNSLQNHSRTPSFSTASLTLLTLSFLATAGTRTCPRQLNDTSKLQRHNRTPYIPIRRIDYDVYNIFGGLSVFRMLCIGEVER